MHKVDADGSGDIGESDNRCRRALRARGRIDNGGKFGFSSASPQQQGGNEGLVNKKVLVYGQWKGGTVHFISSRKGGKRLCERFAGLVEYRYFLY